MHERYQPSQDALDTARGVEDRLGWVPLQPEAGYREPDFTQKLYEEEAETPEDRIGADAFVTQLSALFGDAEAIDPLAVQQMYQLFQAVEGDQETGRYSTQFSLRQAWGAAERRVHWAREAGRSLDDRVWINRVKAYRLVSNSIEDALPEDQRPLPF